LRQVLWAEVANGTIEVHVLAHKKKNASAGLTLVNVNGKIHAEDVGSAPNWAEELMKASYLGKLEGVPLHDSSVESMPRN
jgi:hypothetical protein